IRDRTVTGVQTCALPILGARFHGMEEVKGSNPFRSTKTFRFFCDSGFAAGVQLAVQVQEAPRAAEQAAHAWSSDQIPRRSLLLRSEERRVGKECRCRWVV